MNITSVFITGDTHGAVSSRVGQLLEKHPELVPEQTALIILGDAGLNYYLNKTDRVHQYEVEQHGVYVYCVHGNHEERPKNVYGMELIHDEFVNGAVWIDKTLPHVRYFADWGIYTIMGKRTLVIGGAYSVDKTYRLQRNFKWFESEQLTDYEMKACSYSTDGRNFDLVLSHTCPLSFQPTDMFLNFIDQSTVDNTMEKWMEELKNKIRWGIWLYGHYHADRIEAPHVEQFFMEIENLDDILARWEKYDTTKELDWWLPLSLKMKRLVESE